MQKKLNIILANAPIRNGNRGCVALTITTLYLLDSLFKENGINYNLYLCDSQDTKKGAHSYNILGRIIKYYAIHYPPYNIKTFVKVISHKKILETFSIYKNADFILDIGQGDSFSDIYGKKRFEFIDRIHVIARRFKIPYCMVPQTFGPFKDKDIAQKAHLSLKKADMCMARDKQSYDYVVDNVSKKNVKEFIDVAFFLPYKKMVHDKEYIHVGFNVSSLLWHGGYTNDNQFGLIVNYPILIKNIISYFVKQPKTIVHLIPHVVGQERGVENDYEISYELWNEFRCKNIVLAPFALGPIEIKSYIAGMDFFMGARMHSTIAAFSSGVPVVPMAYSRKFNGLYEDTLNYHHVVDMKTLEEEVIISVIIDSFENRETLKKEIKYQQSTTIKEKGVLLNSELTNFFGLK